MTPEKNPRSEVIPFTPQKAVVLDVGSANIKILYWDGSPSLVLPKSGDPRYQSINLETYAQSIEVGTTGKFKLVRTDDILPRITEKLTNLEKEYGGADLYVLTGFSHSLAVNYPDEFGNPRSFILLDEPSAQTELTPDQHAVIRHFMPDPQIFDEIGVKLASSLEKILFIQNFFKTQSKDAIKQLFGNETTFDKLHFSTMRGLIAENIVNRQRPSDKLHHLVSGGGETRSFLGGNIGIAPQRAQRLMDALGVSRSQMTFLKDPILTFTTEDGRERKIFFIQDNDANLWFINHLLQLGQSGLDKAADFGETDSIIKIGRLDIGLPAVAGIRYLEGMEYSIQRMGSNASNIVARRIADYLQFCRPAEFTWGYNWYDQLPKILNDHKSKEVLRFFYFPDVGDRGILLERFKNGEIKAIDPFKEGAEDQLKDYSTQELLDMIFVIARDVFFGIRSKQEAIRKARGQDPHDLSTYLHGGFVSHRDANIALAAQCLAGRVFKLGMPFAGQAAFLAAMYIFDGINRQRVDDFTVTTEEVITTFKREEEYAIWKSLESRANFLGKTLPKTGIVFPTEVIKLPTTLTKSLVPV